MTAIVACGTTTTTALTDGIKFVPGWNSGMSAADVATMALAIKNDQVNGLPVYPNAFSSNGILYVPNRGQLQLLPGDYVMVDPITGWPILVSSLAITHASSVWNT